MGVVTTERHLSAWEKSEIGAVIAVAYDGEIDEDGGDKGYIVEIEISRSSLPISNGRMLVNFAMTDWELGTDAVASSSTETSNWIEISGL